MLFISQSRMTPTLQFSHEAHMRKLRYISLLLLLTIPAFLRAADPQPLPAKKPLDVLNLTLLRLTTIADPAEGAPAQTYTTQFKITRADGLPKELKDAVIDLAFQ